MDERLKQARDPLGRQLFYPPGSHPATARLRASRDRLLALPETHERNAALEHHKRELARFEALESEAKLLYVRSL
jgi:hypothetical protein